MTSYLRSIFGGNPSQPIPVQKAQSTQSHSSHRSKSHTRSYSSPSVNAAAANYIYSTPSAKSSHSQSGPTTKRSQSFSARTKALSPLRYGYESAASYAASDDGKRGHKRSSLQRSSSYKLSSHSGGHSGYTSSRSNSSSSFLPGTSRSRSNSLRFEQKPSVKLNHSWHGSHSSSGAATPTYASINLRADAQRHKGPLQMHPLLATTRLHSAPISYDVLYTPSTRTVLDRTTQMAVPTHTLSQPATEPPTPASSRIVLRSDKFPWPVVAGPSSSKSGPRFYLGGSDKGNRSAITNLDLLYALHTTLLTRVTPQEWESLGHGSRAQRKVTQAYEKRCQRMGGGWEGGVRRIDWLHGKTKLIGVEIEKYGQGHGIGKLVFARA